MTQVGLIEREFSSTLDSSVEAIWISVTSLEGINHELMPYASMHSTAGYIGLRDLPQGQGNARLEVTLRLGGLLPIGVTTIELVELGERHFIERSKQPGMAEWQHARHVEPCVEGARVTDRLRFRPAVMPGVATAFVERLFRHRHRRLVSRWNGRAG